MKDRPSRLRGGEGGVEGEVHGPKAPQGYNNKPQVYISIFLSFYGVDDNRYCDHGADNRI